MKSIARDTEEAIGQSRPFLERRDFDYIADIVKSGQIVGGRLVNELQNEFCKILGVKYSSAVSSGTGALHLALASLGITEGDQVIIPSYTCSALLNAVNYVNANPVIIDVEPETFNLTASIIKKHVTKKTKALIVTHTFGFPADMDGILKLGIPVIEDCAHAAGSIYKGKPAGSLGHISVFSMYATKMLAAGEGGMVCTNDKKIAQTIMDLNGYDMKDSYRVRYNYKMSDLAAGLTLNQLRKFDCFVKRRKAIAGRYKEAFSPLPLKFQQVLSETVPSFYRFVICASKAKEIIDFTTTKAVMCDRPVYKPLHSYLEISGDNNFAGTDFIWNNAVSVPIYPALKDDDVSRVIAAVIEAFKQENLNRR